MVSVALQPKGIPGHRHHNALYTGTHPSAIQICRQASGETEKRDPYDLLIFESSRRFIRLLLKSAQFTVGSPSFPHFCPSPSSRVALNVLDNIQHRSSSSPKVMVTSATSDPYSPFQPHMLPEEGPQSSEEGSGIHSPVFGAAGQYSTHGDSCKCVATSRSLALLTSFCLQSPVSPRSAGRSPLCWHYRAAI